MFDFAVRKSFLTVAVVQAFNSFHVRSASLKTFRLILSEINSDLLYFLSFQQLEQTILYNFSFLVLQPKFRFISMR
jgi:hypothetical protein